MKLFLKRLWSLSKPYFTSEDRFWAWGLLFVIISLNLSNVYLSVLFNSWRSDFFDSFQTRDKVAFDAALLRFAYLAFGFMVMGVYSSYLNQMLQIRWRRWMTVNFISRWLANGTFYRLQLAGNPADNPDQRVAEDIGKFIQLTLNLSLGLLSSTVSLLTFLHILWGLSGLLSVPLSDGNSITIHGYLVWVALVYSIAGTLMTMKVGRPLVDLGFHQQRVEADFRFNLIRVRENAESIAFYKGEQEEQQGLFARFSYVFDNFRQIMKRQKTLSWFTSGYGQIAVIFPYVVVAPRFFSGQIMLGALMQTAEAFDRVRGSLSFIVDSYSDIALWRAVIQRLTGFLDSLTAAENLESGVSLTRASDLSVTHLEVALPDGQPLLRDFSLQSAKQSAILVQGPSGSGKSTLLRVLAGLWPFAHGGVTLPEGKVLFLPQKPYLPLGSLRDALLYPGRATLPDAELKAEMETCQIGHLAARLDESAPWSHILSLGEQQRIAFLRAMIVKPDVIFLDEATSALDEASESYFYKMLRERLPRATVLSVGHRNTLREYHDREITLRKAAA